MAIITIDCWKFEKYIIAKFIIIHPETSTFIVKEYSYSDNLTKRLSRCESVWVWCLWVFDDQCLCVLLYFLMWKIKSCILYCYKRIGYVARKNNYDIWWHSYSNGLAGFNIGTTEEIKQLIAYFYFMCNVRWPLYKVHATNTDNNHGKQLLT